MQKLFEDIQRRITAKPMPVAEPSSIQSHLSASEMATQQASVTAPDNEVPAPREMSTVSRPSAPPEPSAVSGALPDSGDNGSSQPASDASISSITCTRTCGESAPQQAAGASDGRNESGGGSVGIATASQPALGTDFGCRVHPVEPSSLPVKGEAAEPRARSRAP